MAIVTPHSILRRAGASLTASVALHGSLFGLVPQHRHSVSPVSEREIVAVTLVSAAPPTPVPPPAPVPPAPAPIPLAAEAPEPAEDVEQPIPAVRTPRRRRITPPEPGRFEQALADLRPPTPPAPPAVDPARDAAARQTLDTYLGALWSRLRGAFVVPATIAGGDARTLKCRLAVRIQTNGRIQARLESSSGNAIFDAAVLDAVAFVNSAPVAPPTEILPQLARELQGPFHLSES